MDCCNLSKDSCQALASVFSSDSPLKELDLSHNNLLDAANDLLSAGLSSPHCKLEVLRSVFLDAMINLTSLWLNSKLALSSLPLETLLYFKSKLCQHPNICFLHCKHPHQLYCLLLMVPLQTVLVQPHPERL